MTPLWSSEMVLKWHPSVANGGPPREPVRKHKRTYAPRDHVLLVIGRKMNSSGFSTFGNVGMHGLSGRSDWPFLRCNK